MLTQKVLVFLGVPVLSTLSTHWHSVVMLVTVFSDHVGWYLLSVSNIGYATGTTVTCKTMGAPMCMTAASYWYGGRGILNTSALA